MLVDDDGTLAGLWFDLHGKEQLSLALERGMTRAHFIEWARRFTLFGVKIDDAVQGVIAVGEGTLHVAVSPKIKGRWLRDLEWVLRRALDRPMLVMTDANDASACAFIRRAGGELFATRGHVKWYSIELDKMWFMRAERRCRKHADSAA